MNEYPTTRTQPIGKEAAMDPNRSSALPRILIDVPLGTPFQEIRDSIFRQAWELAGTQLRAAIALGITPETISRTLRRYKEIQAGVGHAAGSAGRLRPKGSTFANQAADFGLEAGHARTGIEQVPMGVRATMKERERVKVQADRLPTEASDPMPVAPHASFEDDMEEIESESGIDKDTEQFDL